MKKIFKEIIQYIVILIIVILIRTFIITPVTVVGSSMYPTLKDKELLLLSKISYKLHEIERFDTVVIKEEEYIIKRIIGLPEDEIYYEDGKLYINNKLVEDKYQYGKTEDFNLEDIYLAGLESEYRDEFKSPFKKIPEGYYLVLGDNRTISKDSRSIGLIKEEEIKGKTVFRFWPLNKISVVK